MSEAPTPTPGGPAAVVKGCTCPTWDNNENIKIVFGKGVEWAIDDNCPLHGVGTAFHNKRVEAE